MLASCGRDPQNGSWSQYASNPVMSPTGSEDLITFGSVFLYAGVYHFFYTYNDASDVRQIGHATSSNCRTWTRDTANNPVLVKSPSGWDTSRVNVPVTWRDDDGYWYLAYNGLRSSDNGAAVCLARASAPGGPYTKYGSNPIIVGSEAWELGASGQSTLDPWGIIKYDGTYYLYYSTISPANHVRSIGVATAATPWGSWTKYAGNPVIAGYRFCIFVFRYGNHFWGICPKLTIPGETGSESVNKACFELWRSLSPYFTNAELVRTVYKTSATNSDWNGRTSDCPSIAQDTIYRDSFPGNAIKMLFSGDTETTAWKTGLIEVEDIVAALTFV